MPSPVVSNQALVASLAPTLYNIRATFLGENQWKGGECYDLPSVYRGGRRERGRVLRLQSSRLRRDAVLRLGSDITRTIKPPRVGISRGLFVCYDLPCSCRGYAAMLSRPRTRCQHPTAGYIVRSNVL